MVKFKHKVLLFGTRDDSWLYVVERDERRELIRVGLFFLSSAMGWLLLSFVLVVVEKEPQTKADRDGIILTLSRRMERREV